MRATTPFLLLGSFLHGCAPSASSPALPPDVTARAPVVAPSGSARPKRAPVAATEANTDGAPQPAAAAFPPPQIAPPHARSAEAGDGRWTPLGDATARERAAEEPRALYVTRLHPHPTSRFIVLTVVAIDLSSVSLGFLPGAKDVGKKKLTFEPGLVPAADRARLLAVFNGGFQPQHGRWGMHASGETIVPPRDTGCTIAIDAERRVRIRSWPVLASSGSELAAFRQTPPCLLEEGEIHRDLLAGRDKAWGGRTPGIVTRRRSAIGIDESGAVLFYAVGVETSPRVLAEGLRFAGARSAAELDINWNWTRFLLFGSAENGNLAVSSALVDVDYGNREYVERPADRDFFYVLRR